MRTLPTLLALFSLSALPIMPGSAAAGAGEPAATASEITPLVVGSSLPHLTVKSAGGEAVDLNAAVAEKPTILIVYRGGW